MDTNTQQDRWLDFDNFSKVVSNFIKLPTWYVPFRRRNIPLCSVYNWNTRRCSKNIIFYSLGLCSVLQWMFFVCWKNVYRAEVQVSQERIS